MEIGVQLFTLREFCTDLKSFEETLKRVADMGYKNIQVSGTCDFEPDWLNEKLKQNGLKCVLTHIAPARLLSNPEKVADMHETFGCKYVGLGCMTYENDGDFSKFTSDYLPVAKGLKSCGKYFMYHNHAHEFVKMDGKLIIDRIAEAFPADILGFTLDTFWVQVGGGNPSEWIEKFAGRVPCIHLKDYAPENNDKKLMMPLGDGNLNFEKIFYAAEKAGTEYMLVEQDDCNGKNPFDCIKRSLDYLKSQGF